MTNTHTNGAEVERIGLALGGGFARGIAHVGILKVLEEYRIPIHCVAGVSAGAIVAAAFASGASAAEIGRIGSAMRFNDVAGWTLSRMGFKSSHPMRAFLKKLLKRFHFEDMRIPLGVVATDLETGEPAVFRERGEVTLPVQASCAYPGLFVPVRDGSRLLVDGAMSMEVPAEVCRSMGATRVISVMLPAPDWKPGSSNVFGVVNRCFQIMQAHAEQRWRSASDLIVSPGVRGIQWDGFASAEQLIRAGEQAARHALASVSSWFALEPARAPGAAAA